MAGRVLFEPAGAAGTAAGDRPGDLRRHALRRAVGLRSRRRALAAAGRARPVPAARTCRCATGVPRASAELADQEARRVARAAARQRRRGHAERAGDARTRRRCCRARCSRGIAARRAPCRAGRSRGLRPRSYAAIDRRSSRWSTARCRPSRGRGSDAGAARACSNCRRPVRSARRPSCASALARSRIRPSGVDAAERGDLVHAALATAAGSELGDQPRCSALDDGGACRRRGAPRRRGGAGRGAAVGRRRPARTCSTSRRHGSRRACSTWSRPTARERRSRSESRRSSRARRASVS